MVGTALILPILPLYALDELGISEQIITLVISSYFAAQFIAGPILGRLSDKYGRLPVLIISQIGTTISFVMMGLANNVWMLLVARVLDGVTGGNIIVAQAYLTDITPRENRTQALGYIFAVFGLGFIIGPAFGGFLSAELGRRIPFYLAAGFAGITTLMSWFMLEESLTPDQMRNNRRVKPKSLSPIEILRNLPLVQILLISFIVQFGLGLVRSTFAFWGNAVIFAGNPEETVLRGVGLLFTTIGLTQFIVQSLLIRRLLKRFGEKVLVLYGNLVRLAGTTILALAKTPLLAFTGAVFFPFGQGVMMPSLQSLATETVEDELRGAVLGIYQSVLNLAIIAGTGLGGAIFAASPALPFWIASGMGVLAILPAFFLARLTTTKRETEVIP